jgi:hypothetical protein
MRTVANRLIAACFALSAFAVAIVSGLSSGNPAGEVLWRAFIAMTACYPLGLMIGMVCERVIIGHIEAHERANPAPDSLSVDAAAHAAAGDEEALVV